ncbi:MAG: phosphate transport system permease protein [Candidatus Omnitrophota bacterium]|jgi:phosphate transport system permease protein
MNSSAVKKQGKGDSLIWFTGSAVTLTLLMTITLVVVILVNGLGYFWPHRLSQAELKDGSFILGVIQKHETVIEGSNTHERVNLKIGNRDLNGLDFKWFDKKEIVGWEEPEEGVVVERMEYGNFYGSYKGLRLVNMEATGAGWAQFKTALALTRNMLKQQEEIEHQMSALNYQLEKLRIEKIKIEYQARKKKGPGAKPEGPAANRIAAIEFQRDTIRAAFEAQQVILMAFLAQLAENESVFHDIHGTEKVIPLKDIVRAYQPNAMSLPAKLGHYLLKIKELILENPRESNTEGGLFPTIFGTIMMVILMSLFCMPMGIVAAVYLREYAKQGFTVRLVRIAVNNLAGVPSIVYGIFGLGFFIYGLGGALDDAFFPHLAELHQPKMKTGGILWASVTLALLTVPVVIVATEEALSSIPRGMREGSLAMGATKWQTIRKVLLPMASPGILTGLILSMARAAGEVAPLMITGVVKLAPSLPVDGQFPFIHLDRKFMHLGFHIYDVGFQSPNVEAAMPMVYVTTMLLLLIVLLLNITAIRVRNKMRKQYTMGAF